MEGGKSGKQKFGSRERESPGQPTPGVRKVLFLKNYK
jgi:hypothetical protein